MTRYYLPSIVGIQSSNPAANVGSVKSEGFDGNFKFDQRIGEVALQLRGNFTYSKNEITEADEMVNRYPYLRNTCLLYTSQGSMGYTGVPMIK